MPHTKTLEFENAYFLQSLFANDLSLLKTVESLFKVKTTTRDGWLKFEGDKQGVENAAVAFTQLEEARRAGTEITPHTFHMMIEGVAKNGSNDQLREITEIQLRPSIAKPAVLPKSQRQLEYLKSMLTNDVVFGIGAAGTGKTYLAMAQALVALREQDVSRIILTRPAVEAGEALGFLPGDLKEKIFPYLRPLYDALYDMLSPEEVEKYIDRGMIEIAPLAYMRGRTLNKSYVVLDEAQNTTCEQMFMFLTRIGEDSRCVVTGDPSQIDLKPGTNSGLLEALDALRETDSIATIRFGGGDVIRHKVVERIISAYEAHRGKSKNSSEKKSN